MDDNASQYMCLSCFKIVRDHHQAVECDICKGWQHRACGDTGITRYMYGKMKKGLVNIDFKCNSCSEMQLSMIELPVAESTGVSFSEVVTSIRMDTTDAAEDLHEEMETDDSMPVLYPVPMPSIINESNVLDDTEINDVSVFRPEFTMIPRGTERGKDLLVESSGYSYTVRKVTKTTRSWWCSVRRNGNRCPAAVSEKGGTYVRNKLNHSHPSDPGCLISRQLSREVKDTAADNVFRSAMAVVEEKISTIPQHQIDNLPVPDQLVRKANRFRQNQRPDDPTTMDFELAMDHIPEDFFQMDVMVSGARHIIFATPSQLSLLAQAKTWYIDGTFKVIRSTDVFDQLFGIHAFIRKDDNVKQVPLAFIFMSRMRKKDYKKVLKKIKNLFPAEPAVKAFMLDFEAAAWNGIRDVFPEARITG